MMIRRTNQWNSLQQMQFVYFGAAATIELNHHSMRGRAVELEHY